MMSYDQLRTALVEEITSIAPDLLPDEVTDDASLRDDYDLDSMDSFNLAAAIHKRLGVNIPDTDFARLQTVAQLITYLENKV
ncbi:acyl carrier protein [Saccharospirillum impatiens]|jgi:acyl carrier protein|uniref:acyl carrier protein n=1 Tax=Saccharospirillum impatiens TaxID=169438 RepID=UPI00041308EC|nr:acyl carrier protein [Saccharospirillum impatiens]